MYFSNFWGKLKIIIILFFSWSYQILFVSLPQFLNQ